MFEILPESKEAVLVIRASGKLTTEDYENILIPKLNELFKTFGKLNVLIEFADDFSCWASTAAAWDDMKIGLEHPNDFTKLALVGAPDWVVWGMRFYGLFVKGEIKVFPKAGKEEALEWIFSKQTAQPENRTDRKS